MRVSQTLLPLTLAFGVAGAANAADRYHPSATYAVGEGSKQVVVTYGVDPNGRAKFYGKVNGSNERGELSAQCQDVHQYAAMWRYDADFRQTAYGESLRELNDAAISRNTIDALFGAVDVAAKVCSHKGFTPKFGR